MTPVLQLSAITKTFGPVVANENVTLSLNKGEMLALLGENGAGKTTLMSILFGHYVADSGTVESLATHCLKVRRALRWLPVWDGAPAFTWPGI